MANMGASTEAFHSPDREGERQAQRLFRLLVAIIVLGALAMAAIAYGLP